ncbi:MAG: polysaccharide deacetylase family protein [candidate division WOR-3 bacterium]
MRKINLLTIFILGAFILSCSFLAYYFTLLLVRGELNAIFAGGRKIPETKTDTLSEQNQTILPAMPKVNLPSITARIGILLPNVEDTNAMANLSDWLDFSSNQNVQVSTLNVFALNQRLNDFTVLILPGISQLSEAAIESITEFLERGGGLIAFGDCGAMDEKGRVRKISLLNRIIGITKITEIHPEYFPLTIKSNSPLSIGLPLGAKIGTTGFGRIRARIIETRTIPDGYWCNPPIDFGGTAKDFKNSVALCHGYYANGRFVWFGFNKNLITGDNQSQIFAQKLFTNALLWVTKNPLVQIKPWPFDYRACAIICGDIEQDFDNVQNVIKILEAKNVKGSFFLLASLAKSRASFVKMMVQNGEIGLHGDHHTEPAGLSYELQLKKLAQAKRCLEKISRQKIVGFRPPYGSYDFNTIRALNKIGLKYLLEAIAEGNYLAPKISRSNYNDFMIIAKPNRDDYDIFFRDSMQNPQAVLQELKEEFERLYDLGSYYLLVYHTQILANPTYYPIIAELIDYIKNKKTWLTTGQEFVQWWHNLLNLELTLESLKSLEPLNLSSDTPRFNLILTNHSGSISTDIALQVFTSNHLNFFKSPDEQSLNWYYDEGNQSYTILIKKIKPNQTIRISF